MGAFGLENPTEPKSAITLDLYTHVLQFGESLRLQDDKLSGLFSIVKAVHTMSIKERKQIDLSFQYCKDLLLAHSVQRPPYSIGLFTLSEMKIILAWILDTYFRHYKLYMYAFTDRVLMSVTQTHPVDIIEAAPTLPALNEAITEEEHMQIVSEEERKAAEEAAAVEAAAAAQAEEERLARLREEYVAAVPDEIHDQVAAAVAREMELLRKAMEEQFLTQQAALQAKVDELEAKVGATAL
ncbi:hypothetical protein CEUSTIGMA_g5084.t1 [Chlamydomonas eustigma]|uniref:Uncharacterized protein n=1 Tax=Chlamydomonas eustigma TaxID=1157962 RepID=A0A250X3K6_9CHLO|nr:hypothetical protein CEUSTIGMA_g5084.t1 [Chlamydomonas eustigma]|eukprot:GAX77641.1 hypothetical protein CEUSTIGMA_g5084.t1 [Chlamydomonas eustigma]